MAYEKLAKQKGYVATEDGRIFGPSGKELRLANISGYLYFGIRDLDGGHHLVGVHRYVAYFFLGDSALEQECVRHLDDDKTNNYLANLSPGSLSQNHQDNSVAWKLAFATAGAHTKRKLSDDQVREIKAKLANGTSMTKLHKEYSVAHGTIQQIKEGKSYKWIN